MYTIIDILNKPALSCRNILLFKSYFIQVLDQINVNYCEIWVLGILADNSHVCDFYVNKHQTIKSQKRMRFQHKTM